MCKDVKNRYQKWDEFARDLVAYIADSVEPEAKIFDTEKFDTLRTLTFFHNFSDVELWEVMRISAWNKFHQDERIITEGDGGRHFYILAQGTVKVLKQGRLLSLLHAGDCFGEMAHLSDKDSKRTTDVVSKTDVTLIELDPELLEKATQGCRFQFNDAFLHMLAKRLAVSNIRISHLLSDTLDSN
jgi:CRP-like cAMP-binding protein